MHTTMSFYPYLICCAEVLRGFIHLLRRSPMADRRKLSTALPVNECFYEKVIKVKADVAALLNLFSDVSIDVRW